LSFGFSPYQSKRGDLTFSPSDGFLSSGGSCVIFETHKTNADERNILHTIQTGKANWIGHNLRGNCFLKHVTGGKTKGKIEMTGRRGRRRKQLLDIKAGLANFVRERAQTVYKFRKKNL
jgi:hypothetical protein